MALVSGHKGVVYNAASADQIIVLARTAGGAARGLTCSWSTARPRACRAATTRPRTRCAPSRLTFDKVSVGADAVLGQRRRGVPGGRGGG